MLDEYLKQLIDSLYNSIPEEVYIGLIILLLLGVLYVFSTTRIKQKGSVVAKLSLVEYIVLIFCSTIVFRRSAEATKFDFTPFWSYAKILRGTTNDLLAENLMNFLVFIPVGLLMGMAANRAKWWTVLLVALCISVSIEAFQFYFKRGFAEFDDVMHNTLGCLVGYGVYSVIRLGGKKRNTGRTE